MRITDESQEARTRSFAVSLSLKSRVPGRDRWAVPAISGNPNRALALETLLRSEAGVRRASANELTGRVLVEYSPHEITEPVERLIQRALAFGPMSSFEFEALTPDDSLRCSPIKLLISAELGCLLFKFTLASVVCPGMGAAAGIAFTLASVFRSRWRARLKAPAATAPPIRVKIDQAS
jgi:hypothetical protein